MWTDEHRGRYDKGKLLYRIVLTNEEWSLIRPLIPPAKRSGNKRTIDEREVVNGLMLHPERGLPVGISAERPSGTQHREPLFLRRQYDGTLDRLNHALYLLCREQARREASPTAAVLDSQSVKKGSARSTRRALMAERRSRARSAMSWLTRRAC